MNLDNICRTCLRIPKEPKYLFAADKTLLKKIQIISSVKIENVSELPSQICEECFNNINHFYNFRKVIINSEHDLQTRLQTLKDTHYASKPRTKIKHFKYEIENASNLYNDVKNELDLPIPNDTDHSDQDYVSKDDFKIRKAIAMKKMFKCQHCNQLFNSRLKLHNHRRTEHTAPGICNICGFTIRADNLKKHIQLHSEEPCTCEECGRTFKNSESLRTHRFTHSDQSYTCDLCGKTFKIKSQHTRHVKKHQDPDIGKTACSYCGKKVNKIKKHMLTHTGEKPYVCAYCNKGFSTQFYLKVHTKQHLNEKP